MPNKFSLPQLKLTVENPFPHIDRITVQSSQSAHDIFHDIWEPDTMDLYESVNILFLTRSMKILGYNRHSFGGIDTSVFDPRIILTTALLSGSTAILVAHNHPSGNPKPSLADERLTKQLKEACALMNITLVDHLIITTDSYYSFKDEGAL